MRILITGGSGLCGSALREEIDINESFSKSHTFYFCNREVADLRNMNEVSKLFSELKPDYVIHTAARVGGIGGNEAMHEAFFYDNISINLNVIRSCIQQNVKKLFAFSSVCAFPNDLTVLEESKMHDGPVFDSNFAYGYAKRMVDVHIRAAEKQYGIKNWVSFIPGNIFGKHDMFSVEHGHIIPSLIYKLYKAKQNNTDFVIWGDGNSYREFIYVNDLAKVLLNLLDFNDLPNRIIVSGRKEYKISEIVNMLVDISKFDGNIIYDTTKPNGQRRRPSSKSVIDSLLPDFEYTDIQKSLKETWNWFNSNYPNIRNKYK